MFSEVSAVQTLKTNSRNSLVPKPMADVFGLDMREQERKKENARLLGNYLSLGNHKLVLDPNID